MSTHAEIKPHLYFPHWPHWATRSGIIVASLGAGVVGLALLVVGLLVDARRAWFAYLECWTFGVSIGIGALVLLMIGHVSKAGWMIVLRRSNEAVVDALPLYLLLAVPLAFGLRLIYPWAEPARAVAPELRSAIEHKRAFLNPPFFIVRTLLYFAIFIAIGALLRAWSKANDQRPQLVTVRRMRQLSGGGLPLVALAVTWAAVDWTMSLEPDWTSTIFGLYFFAGGFVGAIALTCVMLRASRGARVTADHGQALGRVLFAMIVFWAYMAFSQLLIYWIADIPAEVAYYGRRTTGSWAFVTYLLVIGHFFVPFFLLLSRAAKRNLDVLASVGVYMFFAHFVDVYWLVMPACDPAGVRPHWLDLGAILFVGGLSCAWIVHRHSTALPLPRHAPELAEGLEYEASV